MGHDDARVAGTVTTSSLSRLLIVHDYSSLGGGAELVVHHLRDLLRGRGIDARLFCSTADAAVPGAEPDHTFGGGTGRLRALREVVNPSALLALRRTLRDFDPEGIYLGMFLTQASPAILRLLAGRAVIWAPNEFRATCPSGTRHLPDGRACSQPAGRACLANGCFRPWGLAPRMVQLSLLRRWLPVIDRTFAPSQAFADTLERNGIRVDGVLPHAVPPHVGTRDRHPSPVVAFAGRLVPEKGTHIAVRAFAQIRDEFPDARLRIAGDGPERSGLELLSRELGVEACVDFLGHLPRPELERELAGAWVQCVPSIWDEPFGLVVIEAQARGTVVVASAVGALPELVVDGQTGYLVPPADPAALAAALGRVLADPRAADRLGDAMRIPTRERFDGDAYVDLILTAFKSIRRDSID